MLGILESQFICNLADCQFGVCHPFFGNIDYLVLYIFLSGHSRLSLYEISKIIGRKAYLVGKVTHLRQTTPAQIFVFEILVQQPLEFQNLFKFIYN